MHEQKQDYALVIGLDHYPNYGSNGRSLRGAIRDAKAFYEWLIDTKSGGGLPKKNVRLVLSSLNTADPPQPRKGKIDDELEALQAQISDSGARRFYFYFSGHGQSQTNNDVFLCLPHWSQNRQAAALSFREYLNEFVLKCLGFKEVVVFMDCCRSRKIGARGLFCENTCAKPVDDAGVTELFVAHATEFQARSFEAATGEITADDEPIVRGHFTEALMAALWGAAARPEGGVTANDLMLYLRKVVPRIANRYDHIQKPKFEPFGIPAGDPEEPVFGAAQPIDTVDVKFNFRDGRTGEILLEGPDLQQIRKGMSSTGPWEETLPLATYLLTDLETDEQKSVHVRPTTGEFNVDF